LKSLLESKDIPKVFLDYQMTLLYIFNFGGISPNGVIDMASLRLVGSETHTEYIHNLAAYNRSVAVKAGLTGISTAESNETHRIN